MDRSFDFLTCWFIQLNAPICDPNRSHSKANKLDHFKVLFTLAEGELRFNCVMLFWGQFSGCCKKSKTQENNWKNRLCTCYITLHFEALNFERRNVFRIFIDFFRKNCSLSLPFENIRYQDGEGFPFISSENKLNKMLEQKRMYQYADFFFKTEPINELN